MAVDESEKINVVLAKSDVGNIRLAKRLAKRLECREKGRSVSGLRLVAPILVARRGVSRFRKTGQASLRSGSNGPPACSTWANA